MVIFVVDQSWVSSFNVHNCGGCLVAGDWVLHGYTVGWNWWEHKDKDSSSEHDDILIQDDEVHKRGNKDSDQDDDDNNMPASKYIGIVHIMPHQPQGIYEFSDVSSEGDDSEPDVKSSKTQLVDKISTLQEELRRVKTELNLYKSMRSITKVSQSLLRNEGII